jgi:hypothetical protein
MRAIAYLAWLGVTVATLAVTVIAFTISVDPYRMFGTPTVRGWTELKPRAYEQLGIAKTYQLERIAPRMLLLGNSRTEIGLDPTSALWPVAQHPVFNAAEAGGNVFTSLLMLREALAVRPPEKIILGLDFLDFLTEANALADPKAKERRLLVDRSGRPNAAREYQIWKDRLASTLTIDAVADSVMTLFDQNPATSATMTPLGYNPLHEYRVFVARNGYHGLFAQKNAIYRKQYATYPKPDFAHPSLNSAYRYLTYILQLATESRIPVMLYIHPYHADYLEILRDVGLWPSFEAWKRVIVAEVELAGHEAPGDVRLFDFSGFDEFTTEPVPQPGDLHAEMRWYWEPGHYKSALGEHILAAIFHDEPHFGRILTPANIESVLAKIREQRARFVGQSKNRLNGLQPPPVTSSAATVR